MILMEEALTAVTRGTVRRLQAALKQQPSLATERDGGGFTLLLRAAQRGSAECLRVLLTAGACIEATTDEGGTAILYAVQEGHEACVRVLLAAGANTEVTSNHGRKPLHFAAQQDHPGCLQQLLDAGTDVDAADISGRTALVLAAQYGHFRCLHRLLTAGANVDAADHRGQAALMVAAGKGHEACVKALLAAGANVEAFKFDGIRALHAAASEGHTACLSLLIAAHANLDAADSYQMTALHCAAGKGHLPVIRCLVAAGASMAPQDANGLTPRMCAIGMQHLQAAQLLLELERQKAGGRQTDVPSSSRTPQQAEAQGIASASTADAEAAAEAAAAQLLAEEEREEEQQAARQAAKAAKRQRQKERKRQQAPVPAGEADEAGSVQAAKPEPAVQQSEEVAVEATAGISTPAEQGASAACSALPFAPAVASGIQQGNGKKNENKQTAAVQPQGQASTGSEAAVQPSAIDSTIDDNAEVEELLRQLGVQTAEEGPSSSAISAPPQATSIAAAWEPPAPATSAAVPAATSLPPGLLSELICPITQEPMHDPVVAADGHTYERSAIEAWMSRQAAAGQPPCSPLTNQPLANLVLHPNFTVRSMVQGFQAAGLLE